MTEIKRTIKNVTLNIGDAGEYNIDGKIIPHEAFIKIKVGKSTVSLVPEDVLSIKALFSIPAVREELSNRYNDEKDLLNDVGF